MNVLVLGAGGMAGHVIALHLEEKGFKVLTLSGSAKLNEQTTLIDVTDRVALDNYLTTAEPDIIVNCIGLLVKESEIHKDLAVYLNAFLPHYLENKYSNSDTRIIHLSTDCVFSGKNAPYKEADFYDGELFYDRAKALGEIINDKDLTFRMSIVGPDMKKGGTGLFNWFYAQTGQISGYSRVMWNGITTVELARGIEAAIDQKLSGLYHLVPDSNISKFELLKLFKKVFDRIDISITPDEKLRFDKTLLNTRDDFSFTVSSYEDMVSEMHAWIVNHSYLYPHYEK